MNHPNLVALGTLMATIGAITSGFGMNLIRSSSKIERSKPWYCRRRLLIGIALACLINTFLDCVAFAIMPLAIIAPIGGVTIVSSVLFARCGLSGETQRFTYTQAVCVAIIVCGVAGVAIFGPHPAPVVNVHQTVHRIHNDSFVIYQIITISALAIVYIAMCTRGGQWLNHTTLTVLCAVAGGMCSGIAQCLMKVLAVAIADYMLHRSLPFALFDFWLSMVELIVIALFLLHMLTTCLSNAPLIISSSLYQVCVIVFTITAGLLSVLVGLVILTVNHCDDYEKQPLSTKEHARDISDMMSQGVIVSEEEGSEAAQGNAFDNAQQLEEALEEPLEEALEEPLEEAACSESRNGCGSNRR